MADVKIIRDLFDRDISRRIEEVIKVDQTDAEIIRNELDEYWVTDSINSYLHMIVERYAETPNKPHEGIGIWVSGFFGSGKSSFAKYLGFALANREILTERAAEVLGRRSGDLRVKSLLAGIAEGIPTEAIIFDVSTDRGIRSGNQSITEIMYRLFLHKLGYARDLDLSELEITLEEEGRLGDFEEAYEKTFGKQWDREKGKISIAVQRASRVMHELEPETYRQVDSWRESAMKRADISPGKLARRCRDLMKRRRPDKNLLFVVDEVGQFVARDVQKMLDLQAAVQNLGVVGRGKMWLMVTSQEKLTEIVSGLDDKRVELARLRDRFPLQVHLEPSDIAEVTSKRVLTKNAEARTFLGNRFKKHRGRLSESTHLTGDVRLPELDRDSFIDLYPLLPYHVNLIISVVSGLRTQGGASPQVGGANRTIIKLAQQLLIHPDVNLADRPVGALATLDKIYDLVSGNISSEIRGKIAEIARVEHPLAQPVAKAICLLQFVQSVHRTPENIAATLHPAVDADSLLPDVRAALEKLEQARMVRLGDEGYKIPTPAEDDWEKQRANLEPRPGDVNRIHAEAISSLWNPQPSHVFLDVKPFKAGLTLDARPVIDGDITFHLTLTDPGEDFTERAEEARTRSREETSSVLWVAALDESIRLETVELYRSRQILSRKQRGARTTQENALVADEKRNEKSHRDDLKKLLRRSLLRGAVFFQGNDRSPKDSATKVSLTAADIIARVLPEVFDRFEEGAAKVKPKDLETLMTTENLRGLTPVFTELELVRDQDGKPIFDTDSKPLAEVLSRIENRTSYGDPATGRYLANELAREPFGWSFDVARLLTIALLRAGKVEATSKGQVIESALSLDARSTFSNNNLYRGASFRPRTTDCEFADFVDGAEAFRKCFGCEIQELEESVVAREIRAESEKHEDDLRSTIDVLSRNDLAGQEVLDSALSQVVGFRKQRDCQAIKAFCSGHLELKEAIKRVSELSQSLTPGRLQDLRRARRVITVAWPFLETEPDLPEDLVDRATHLQDILARETFYRELPTIDEHTRALEQEYERRHAAAVRNRVAAYTNALAQLRKTPGWEQLDEEQRDRVSEPLTSRTTADGCTNLSIPMLREQTQACPTLLSRAIEEMLQLLDGNRIVRVDVASYFTGGVETEEQLDQALSGFKDQCLELIGSGNKVIV